MNSSGNPGVDTRASATYAEIMHQPESWAETVARVPVAWDRIREQIGRPIDHAVFMGSGTSLYIAQSAAHAFMEVTGTPATAIPTSEAFLSAASTLPRSGTTVAFIISRSGSTSEALLAAKSIAENQPDIVTVGVTCSSGSRLAALCDSCLELTWAFEHSVVMTQSFTTMLLALQLVAARIAGDTAFASELARVPEMVRDALPALDATAQALGQRADVTATIFLGLGPYSGLAEEGALKLKEMTQSICEAYNPLEFRHGPISIVDQQTLVIYLQGQREHAYIADIEHDLRALKASVFGIGPQVSADDQHLAIGSDLGDLARSVLYLPLLQLMGYYKARALGLDPDRPRNLNPVVVLNGV